MQRKTTISLITLLLLLGSFYYARYSFYWVGGSVRDGITGDPIPDAIILIRTSFGFIDYHESQFQYTHADKNGNFGLLTRYHSIDHVIASKEGYRADGLSVPKNRKLTILLYPEEVAAQYPLQVRHPFIQAALDDYANRRAGETGDDAFCRSIVGSSWKDNCYQDVAWKKMDPYMCGNVSSRDEKVNCVFSFAFGSKQPEICETLEETRDPCYSRYARSTHNGDAWCEKVLSIENRDECYLEIVYSAIHGDLPIDQEISPGYCNKIVFPSIRERCLSLINQ